MNINFNWPGQDWWRARNLRKNTQHAILLCQKFYMQVQSFTLAQRARAEQEKFAYEYIYGEIDLASFATLLSHCIISENSIFYDLGSGAGKAVICAALLYNFKKSCGIEQLQLLHDCAVQVQQSQNALHIKNIYFYQNDLLTLDWREADIVFINATMFIGEFWQQLLAQLKQLKPGTQIILVSKALASDHFQLVYSDVLPMSWGAAQTSIYVVK